MNQDQFFRILESRNIFCQRGIKKEDRNPKYLYYYTYI